MKTANTNAQCSPKLNYEVFNRKNTEREVKE